MMKITLLINRHYLRKIWNLVKVLVLLVIVLSLFLPSGLLFADPGGDGDLVVSATDVILNRYSAVTNISGNVVTVNDVNELADGGAGHYANETLSAGDMILIYQAQGATFTNSGNSPSYGAFDYNNAGGYEFGLVAGVSGNDITVDDSNTAPYSCGGISNAYNIADGNVQVVRVPQYEYLTINNTGSVIAADWDGSTGGVIALLTHSTVVVNGAIDASGSGFRGGVLDNSSLGPNFTITDYRSSGIFFGGEKGESILGFNSVYQDHNGQYGRGAPANGGGGGNPHNAGGGGGANGFNGGSWNGAGSPDTSDSSWDNAWDLDDGVDDVDTPLPMYFVGGSGGGRGGYSFSINDEDAAVVEPGNILWDGHDRQQLGGLGGRPLLNDPSSRLFFGGGGGAGDNNNATGSAGAAGGGLIILGMDALFGSGLILSNGQDAEDTIDEHNDGAGGGGAGGSIVMRANSLGGVAVNAVGGTGGDHGLPTPITDESFGPGGGGGGGYVAVNSLSGLLTTDVSGGANGINGSTALDEFLPNGATYGYEGGTSSVAFTFPGCSQPTAITLVSADVFGQAALWPVGLFLILLLVTFVLLKSRVQEPVKVRRWVDRGMRENGRE